MSPGKPSAPRVAPAAEVGSSVIGAHAGGVLFGLIFGLVPVFVLNVGYGLDFRQPLDAVGPARLWWMLAPAALALAFTAYGAWARRPVLVTDSAWFEAAPSAVGTVFLLFLWAHRAFAFLWPAAAFTVLYTIARAARWEATEALGLELDTGPAPAGAKTPVAAPSAESASVIPSAVADPAREFPALRSAVRFEDVLGMAREKRSLLDFAREVSLGRGNGALLFGPPGSGKTFLVEALAGELGVPLISVSIARFASVYVNETTQRVVAAFAAAREQAPCMLFFDELDAVMGSRGATTTEAEAPRIVAALLTELVAIRGQNVMVLAATNFPERLDAAGRREGRFDLKIEIGLPDAETRRAILKRGIGKDYEHRVREGTLEMACRHFEGFSIARLSAIAAQARRWLEADTTGMGQLQFQTLLQALRKLQGLNLAHRYEGVPELGELVLDPRTREEIESLAATMADLEEKERQGSTVTLGAVFYGPPGTGKTLTAKALAKAARWSFVATTGHDLLRTEDAMDKVLERASDERPAILFIDEADDILGERTVSPPHTRIATNKLFTLLDGERGRIPDVFFIAATNHPQALDEAALRRFPLKIAFALPGFREIAHYVTAWLAKRAVACAPDFTPRAASRILAGCSIAEAEIALQQAVNIAVSERARNSSRSLGSGDLTRAVRSLSFG